MYLIASGFVLLILVYSFMLGLFPSLQNVVEQDSSTSQSSISIEIGRAVEVLSLNIESYWHEESYASMDKTLDRNNSLRDIDEAHCRALAESFKKY